MTSRGRFKSQSFCYSVSKVQNNFQILAYLFFSIILDIGNCFLSLQNKGSNYAHERVSLDVICRVFQVITDV